jgi:hypothetical protein
MCTHSKFAPHLTFAPSIIVLCRRTTRHTGQFARSRGVCDGRRTAPRRRFQRVLRKRENGCVLIGQSMCRSVGERRYGQSRVQHVIVWDRNASEERCGGGEYMYWAIFRLFGICGAHAGDASVVVFEKVCRVWCPSVVVVAGVNFSFCFFCIKPSPLCGIQSFYLRAFMHVDFHARAVNYC